MNKGKLSTTIKVCRAKAKLTQSELAKKSGVGLCTIALIESTNNKYMPSVDTLVKLAEALNVSSEKFIKYL